MLLSFSIPSMLPMILTGLREIQGDAPTHELIEAEQWARGTFPKHVANFSRTKRQTIRRDAGDRSAYAGLRVGDPLHLWWKSRTEERRPLGVIACVEVEPIVIGNMVGLMWVETNTGRRMSEEEVERLIQRDGFDDSGEALNFFGLEGGEARRYWRIRW